MSKRDQPALYLVLGDKDPELHHQDLEWYYRCAASLCGIRSSMGGQVAVLEGIAGGSYATESNFYSDAQTGWPDSGESYVGRCRRIFQALTMLTWTQQQTLEIHYEYKREPVPLSESAIREAHRAFIHAIRQTRPQKRAPKSGRHNTL